jgi:hypothetical protein
MINDTRQTESFMFLDCIQKYEFLTIVIEEMFLNGHYENFGLPFLTKGASPKCRGEFVLSESRGIGASLQIRASES